MGRNRLTFGVIRCGYCLLRPTALDEAVVGVVLGEAVGGVVGVGSAVRTNPCSQASAPHTAIIPALTVTVRAADPTWLLTGAIVWSGES